MKPLTTRTLVANLMQPGLWARTDRPPSPWSASIAEPSRPDDARPALRGDGGPDPAWFGPGIAWARVEGLGQAWIRPGLNLWGRTVQVGPWEEPCHLKPGRGPRDLERAAGVAGCFPDLLREALGRSLQGRAGVSPDTGDLLLRGRVVDARAGSRTAKLLMGAAGRESAAWDLKLSDAGTGEVLLAAHHRALSLTAASTLEGQLARWAERFAEHLVRNAGPEAGLERARN